MILGLPFACKSPLLLSNIEQDGKAHVFMYACWAQVREKNVSKNVNEPSADQLDSS